LNYGQGAVIGGTSCYSTSPGLDLVRVRAVISCHSVREPVAREELREPRTAVGTGSRRARGRREHEPQPSPGRGRARRGRRCAVAAAGSGTSPAKQSEQGARVWERGGWVQATSGAGARRARGERAEPGYAQEWLLAASALNERSQQGERDGTSERNRRTRWTGAGAGGACPDGGRH
jgi:hypothetical protein